MTPAFAQEAAQNQDVQGEIDVNVSSIFERIDAWVDGVIKLLPNIVTALIIIAIF